MEIARQIGYTPNAAARSLSSKRANAIGMIVPTMMENSAYSTIFNQISMISAENGFSVMLRSSHRSLDLERRHCQMMCENRVGALIVASATSDVSHITEACHGLFPIIFIGGKTGLEQTYALTIDYKYSARLAVEYLCALGHKDIALFTYGPENNTIRQKEDGFSKEMKQRGLLPRICTAGHADDTSAAGIALVENLIADHALPTAIWCASDLMAIGVLNALRIHGLRIPEDISVIGHDDLYFSSLAGVELTTLHTPMQELGEAAAKLAIALIEAGKINPR